jgi:hypothetical protein
MTTNFVARLARRRIVWAGLAVGAVVVAVALAAFQPWKLWVDEVVDEAAPASASVGPSSAAPGGVVELARGAFISHEHPTTGTALVLQGPDGRRYLRLENLDTSNGPLLKVWLADAPVRPGSDGWHVFDDGRHVDLGPLKGTRAVRTTRSPPTPTSPPTAASASGVRGSTCPSAPPNSSSTRRRIGALRDERLPSRSLHAVAELVLAGPQHRRKGEIALMVEPTGFGVRTELRLRVDGARFVAGDQRIPIDGANPARWPSWPVLTWAYPYANPFWNASFARRDPCASCTRRAPTRCSRSSPTGGARSRPTTPTGEKR